jgi:hypothetical protein
MHCTCTTANEPGSGGAGFRTRGVSINTCLLEAMVLAVGLVFVSSPLVCAPSFAPCPDRGGSLARIARVSLFPFLLADGDAVNAFAPWVVVAGVVGGGSGGWGR